MVSVRKTTEADEAAIWRVQEAAFGGQAGRTIADLTIALLHDPTATPFLSLLAYSGSAPIGHVLFTSVSISGSDSSPTAHILAPLAVVPEHQRQGTGTQLVQAGLSALEESGSELVFVLGHPEYYPRFGFLPAGQRGFSAPYPIEKKNASAWMVLELRPGVIESNRGAVQCAEALNDPAHWRE
ncbi:MAG: N-acetyltransferase [Planctomycetes bacterium]|nr:N-acetyltransferase [Planctomycetota bacterium]